MVFFGLAGGRDIQRLTFPRFPPWPPSPVTSIGPNASYRTPVRTPARASYAGDPVPLSACPMGNG